MINPITTEQVNDLMSAGNQTADNFNQNEAGTMLADEVLNTVDELADNKIYQAKFECYENVMSRDLQYLRSEYDTTFLKAYVVGKEVFILIRNNSGNQEQYFNKVSVSSCIHSGALRFVVIKNNVIHLGERNLENCKSNRELAATEGYAIAS